MLSDIFAVQDEIAAAIAGALKLKLVPTSERRMPSLPAYEAYLKYRSYQWQFTREASQRSRECLERALAHDPEFALPYVGLADYHLALASVGGMPASEAMPRARQLATRALAIDPELPEAHAMLGIIAGHYDYDWGEAERRFRAAVKREPLSTHLRQWYASFWLLTIGRSDDALLQLARVIDEDPLCQMWHYLRSGVLERLGRQDEALAALRTAIELDPKFWLGSMHLARSCAIRGQHAEAMHCAEKAMAAAPWSPYSIGLMAGAFANMGQAEKAEPLPRDIARRFVRGTGRTRLLLSCPRRYRQGRRMGWEGGRTALPGFYHGCHSPVRAAVPPIGRLAERVEGDEPRLTRHAACCRSLRVVASRAPGPGVTPTLEKLLGAMPAHARSDP
jgi:serine/threonine-protein kinase